MTWICSCHDFNISLARASIASGKCCAHSDMLHTVYGATGIECVDHWPLRESNIKLDVVTWKATNFHWKSKLVRYFRGNVLFDSTNRTAVGGLCDFFSQLFRSICPNLRWRGNRKEKITENEKWEMKFGEENAWDTRYSIFTISFHFHRFQITSAEGKHRKYQISKTNITRVATELSVMKSNHLL